MVPRTTSMQRATPWEQYHSRKINSKTNLKTAFEDCAEAHRNIIDNTMKSGARDVWRYTILEMLMEHGIYSASPCTYIYILEILSSFK